MTGPRNANGESSIYKGTDGWWHGRVTIGVKDDGTPDRRHRRGKTRNEVVKKVRKLEKLRDEGSVPKAGQRYRVHEWLTYWVHNIACPPNEGYAKLLLKKYRPVAARKVVSNVSSGLL